MTSLLRGIRKGMDFCMEIRLAAMNDIEALCPLLTEFYAYNAALQPVYCEASVENGKYPETVIESDDEDFIIAIEDAVVVGFIHIHQMKTPAYDSVVPYNYAEIMSFMVTSQRREQGIGSKLIESAKQWSKARNLAYIELFSLTNANEANRFYDKENFVTVSHNRRYTL